MSTGSLYTSSQTFQLDAIGGTQLDPTDMPVDEAYFPSLSLSPATTGDVVWATGAGVPFRPSQRIRL